jgi:hypothetical protein
MKTALSAVVILTLCAFSAVGNAWAQDAPEPGSEIQTPPGVILTPPWTPPTDTQQSCPDTRKKLELIV